MNATQKAAGLVTSTRGPAALDLHALRQAAEEVARALSLAQLDAANAEASARRRQVGAVVWCLAQERRHLEAASTAAAQIVGQLDAFGQIASR